MRYTTLGRTNLKVSIAGIGCGGHSRLGMSQGKDLDHAADVLRRAIDRGVNFIDTATNYRTEPAVARAIAGIPRDELVISSKAGVRGNDGPLSGEAYTRCLEDSLQRLGIDHIDIYHLHGLSLEDYDHAVRHIVPALLDAQRAGKLRHLAVSEQFIIDPSHDMLRRALQDDHFDVAMVGHNMLNPSARHTVLPKTTEKQIGTLCMFAVRRALSRPEALHELIRDLIDQGKLDREKVNADDPLGFLDDVVEAGYRFCVHEPGIDVVLFGTGNPDHVDANIRAINAPPLPDEHRARLQELFGHLDCVSGN